MKNEISNILNLIKNGHNSEAVREAKKLHIKNPTNIDVIKILAYSFIQIGNFEKVIEILKYGYEEISNNKDYDFFNNMGYAYSQLENYEKSINFLQSAIEIYPSNIESYVTLADVYQKLKHYDKAEELINKTLSKAMNDPHGFSIEKNINLLLLKYENCSSLEKEHEAINLFHQLLKKNFNADLFYLLTRIKNNGLDNSDLINLAESKLSLKDGFSSLIQQTNFESSICYGLGNFYQKKDEPKSEKYFIDANTKIYNISRYNSHSYQSNILSIIDNYNKYFTNYDEASYLDGSENFFIMGSPRSGTTLLESVVTSNKFVFSGGEKILGKRLMEKFNASSEKDLNDFRVSFLSQYVKETNFIKHDYKYIVDKMPENFLYIGMYQKILPASKIIRVLRRPWDIATSLFKERYIFSVPYSTSFFNIGIFLANFEAINTFWNDNIKIKKNILDVRYEELVQNPKTIDSIYSFLGIDPKEYDPGAREKFFSNTASMGQVKGDIHQNSIKKDVFKSKKSEFYDAFFAQRRYWQQKGILKLKDDFFGYKFDH